MAFVRFLNTLLKDKNIGQQIVPIIADEARTFRYGRFIPSNRYLQPTWSKLCAF